MDYVHAHNENNFILISFRIDLAQPWLQARRYITPITVVCNNAGTYELLPQPPHLIRARSSYATLYKASCLRRRRSAIIIIMPLSLHCGGKRWGDTRARSKSGERKGPTVKADVKLANQISPGIISVRAAKHPAAKRETTTSHAYNSERSEFNSHSSRKKIKIIQTCQATSRGVHAIFFTSSL